MRRGEIWWADLGEPVGSGPGDIRPVVIISADRFNESSIRTVIVAILTSNLRVAGYPGNFSVARRVSGLASPSVVNVSQLVSVDRRQLTEHVGRLGGTEMKKLAEGLKLVLDL